MLTSQIHSDLATSTPAAGSELFSPPSARTSVITFKFSFDLLADIVLNPSAKELRFMFLAEVVGTPPGVRHRPAL